MFTKKQKLDPKLKAQQLYGTTPAPKAVAKLVFSGLLVMVFLALFTFIDKLMLINLLPTDSNYSFAHLFGQDFKGLSVQQINSSAMYTGWYVAGSSVLVREAVSMTFALNGMIFAIPALYVIGTAVRYSQAIALNDHNKIKAIWVNGLYGDTFFTLFGIVLMLILIPTVTPTQSKLVDIIDYNAIVHKYGTTLPNGVNLMTFYHDVVAYNHTSFKIATTWAEDFLYILTGFMWLSSFDGLFNTVIRADGFLTYVTIVNFVSIALNIVLDYVFIKLVQIGMDGAAVATVIGWTLETIMLIIFIGAKLQHRVLFKDLFAKVSLHFKLMLGLAMFGSTVFISQVALVITNTVFLNQMSSVANTLYPGFGAEYVLGLVGAVAPIITLFLQPVFGVLRYLSPYFSFNYVKHNQTRFQAGHYLTWFYVFCYGLFFYIFVTCIPPVTNGFLSLFRVDSSVTVNFATKLLRIWFAQIMLLSFSLSAMVVFLAANRVKIALTVNILRSLIVPLPLIILFAYIAKTSNNIWWFFAEQPVAASVNGLILFIWSSIFVHINVKIPFNHLGKVVLPQKLKVYK